jgi:eukaryotic-like serine/threonine-protein kinase
MTPERWQRIQEIFGEAIELPIGPAREAFLEQECADDAELRTKIRQMLVLDDASSVLDATPRDLAEAVRTLEPDGNARPTVGPYRIVREIGRGGMGAVYLAEREDVGKRVALKLVRGGLAAPEHLERFLIEQRVLARLEHPNIAPLLDAGTTEDGTSYLAMELVEGEPLDTFCDTRRLTLPERLSLFAQVCEAVQYAHQNLVVHRDLKPSNILVTSQGVVKLLDFGIAKLLASEGDDTGTGITRTGARLLTPEYAAPEQVLGESITTATDVYSLGVVLYELLTGHRPFETTGRRWGELEGEVLTRMPTRPSSAVARSRDLAVFAGTSHCIDPEEISAARSTTPVGLQRALRGDLDTIVLKALEKGPSRRYASARQLLDDLERHRQGVPILARPATFGYRTHKFVRRHRAGVAASAAFLTLIAGMTAVIGIEQAGASRERERAHLEAEKVELAAEFLGQLFATSDPRQARGRLISTPALLEWGERNASVLQRQPEVKAQVLTRIGEAYVGLGLYQRATPLFERALELRRALHPGDHPDVAGSLWWVAVMRTEQAAFGESERLFRESLAMRRRLFGNEHPQVVEGLSGLGFVLVNRGDLHSAEQAYREGLSIEMPVPGGPPRTIPGPLNGLAFSLIEQGRYAEAEPHAREALASTRVDEGMDHPFYMIALAHLARALHGTGEVEEAEALFREAIEKAHRIQGERHPRLAVYLEWYASLLMEKGDAAGAERAYRRALEIQRQALAPAHFFLVPTLVGLGQLLTDTHRPQEAEPLLREALAVGQQRLPATHPNLAQARSELGACLAALGRTAEAEPLLAAGYAALREALGKEHPLTRRARERLSPPRPQPR